MAARVRFGLFCIIVLALPAGLMALDDPRIGDLGKLVMILSPAVAGLALNWGLGKRDGPIRWRSVGLAALVTLTIAGLALAAALVTGAASFSPARFQTRRPWSRALCSPACWRNWAGPAEVWRWR